MHQRGLLGAILSTYKAKSMGREALWTLQLQRLRRLLAHAKQDSPYYRNLYGSIDTACSSLTDLPPTNKVDLMSSFDYWLTDRSITHHAVERFMQNKDNIGRRMNHRYLVYTTSGSTGNPSLVLADKTTFHVSAAISALRGFARKSDLHTFMKRGKKTAGLYAADGFYLGSGSMRHQQLQMPWRKNQLIVNVLSPMEEIVDKLNAFQPAMLGSYPSMLELLLQEQLAGRLHISPVVIMPGGEYVREELRERLTEGFGAYVQIHYSCTEAGVIACACEHNHLHINEDWCIVEAVDAVNRPIPAGEQSCKALITNLANYTQPFIRYELNDRIILHDEKCACGSPFRWLEIEGRNDEILEFTNGVRIPPMALFALLKEIPEIKRYQIVQHAHDRLEVRLTAEDKAAAFSMAKHTLVKYLASKQTIADVYLSELEPQVHPKSGKFRAVYRQ